MFARLINAKLDKLISGKVFETIPQIEKLNHPKIDTGNDFLFVDRYTSIPADYDFIDLGALAHNIKYMLMRQYITQSLEK